MKEALPDPKTNSHGGNHRSSRRPDPHSTPLNGSHGKAAASSSLSGHDSHDSHGTKTAMDQLSPATDQDSSSCSRAVNTPQAAQPGAVVEAPDENPDESKEQKIPVAQRFWRTFKVVLFNSKLNLLLVFVPVGIVVAELENVSPAVIFAMNAVAIVPLAGLLSFATESVAHRLGDSLGALLNVTFGNAVELIIFILALVKNEIRIVQASMLGSILSNLLLILGMSFFLGGLRFREQIYNSTVTQMSACLLSLSVISLVLPTAFHASFSDNALADAQSLKISRGTSVILLLVYIVYLLFQLISHSYLYESTPQHIIDEESTPGPAANWLDSSSDSSSSSDSDSSDSDHSRGTISKRMRRVMRRRRPSVVSSEAAEIGLNTHRTSSGLTSEANTANDHAFLEKSSSRSRTHRHKTSNGKEDGEDSRDYRFGRRHRRHGRKHRKEKQQAHETLSPDSVIAEIVGNTVAESSGLGSRRVDFALHPADQQLGTSSTVKGLRGMSLMPVVSSLTPTVFTQPADASMPSVAAGPVPRVRYGIRRTNSLPGSLSQYHRAPGAMMPSQIPLAHRPGVGALVVEDEHGGSQLSRTAAVILLVVSTALVAVCAEAMVGSINGLVAAGGVGETFIGLIVLPIVGNAAEHVTAITVALKNKMDLAIGVAVGSSIQVALFITPLVVVIGWALEREMTLYFTLFETVCLFVSAFITNFLVLDGRSNYLEGALLMATYVIIAVAAFYYPDVKDASALGA
ncbi:calcium/proton exchanger [Parathielavia hyrcaniae]|uniref:Calcium/proton exchanger n=1 Tax=Parathielavia hyrcaniae TaxID=113614 RepID=A0AAN6PZJ8_9PEZI|nr:calcium/proton exchanger [Parathielavia hyrcaniae]